MRIGISACFFHADPQRAIFKGKTLLYLEQSMSHWIMSEGVTAYLIPQPLEGGRVGYRELARELDGLVLQGGSDVSPKSYGETALKPEWNGDFIRDGYEISLLKEFLGQGKPVIGVCRGAQLMNVAFGGTLYQDIGTQLPAARNHRNWDIYDQNFHGLKLEAGSFLEKTAASAARNINSIHHQAVKDLGKGLVVEARCDEDGVVEAIRHAGERFCLAVQWHPEFHDTTDKNLFDSKPLLRDFLKAATERR
jgi:putative glutamine amidotransferase